MTPERRAEYHRTIDMLKRCAERQADGEWDDADDDIAALLTSAAAAYTRAASQIGDRIAQNVRDEIFAMILRQAFEPLFAAIHDITSKSPDITSASSSS